MLGLGKYHTSCFLFISLASFAAYAQMPYELNSLPEYIKNNVVVLEIEEQSEEIHLGFGAIIAANKNRLYIAAAIEGDIFNATRREIMIRHMSSYKNYAADIEYVSGNYRYLILSIVQPANYLWDYRYHCNTFIESFESWSNRLQIIAKSESLFGDIVVFEGHKLEIDRSKAPLIEALFKKGSESSIGSPVIHNKKLAGLVINDQKGIVSFLAIGRILRVLGELLELPIDQNQALPIYFSGGISSGIYSNIGFLRNSFGIYLEAGILQKLALRVEGKYNLLPQTEFRSNERTIPFRNRFPTINMHLLLGDWQFGYSLGKINPEVMLDGVKWVKLENSEMIDFDYSRWQAFYTIGLEGKGWSPFKRSWLLSPDISFTWVKSSSIYVDDERPLNGKDHSWYLLALNFRFGFAKIGERRKKICLEPLNNDFDAGISRPSGCSNGCVFAW